MPYIDPNAFECVHKSFIWTFRCYSVLQVCMVKNLWRVSLVALGAGLSFRAFQATQTRNGDAITTIVGVIAELLKKADNVFVSFAGGTAFFLTLYFIASIYRATPAQRTVVLTKKRIAWFFVASAFSFGLGVFAFISGAAPLELLLAAVLVLTGALSFYLSYRLASQPPEESFLRHAYIANALIAAYCFVQFVLL